MIKIFKQGIGIAEKSQETRRDRWIPYFDSTKIHMTNHWVKIGIVVYIITPTIPSCFLAFFSNPYSLFENFIFLIILVRVYVPTCSIVTYSPLIITLIFIAGWQ